LGRPDAGSHAGLAARPAEEASSGLLEHLELGVLLIDAELVERGVLGVFDRLAGRLDPLHQRRFFFFFDRLPPDGRGGVGAAGFLAPLLVAAGEEVVDGAGVALGGAAVR
jgi:hypothetical protein